MPEVCELGDTSQAPASGTRIPPASPVRGGGDSPWQRLHRVPATCPVQPAQPGHSRTPCAQAGDKDSTPRKCTTAAGWYVPTWEPYSTGPRARTKSSLQHQHQPRGSSNLPQPAATPRGGPHRPTVHPRGTAWLLQRWHQVRSKSRPAGAGSKPAQSRRGVERSCLHSCAQRGGASQPREGDVWKSTG